MSSKENEDLFYSLIDFIQKWRNEHKEPLAEKLVSKESDNAVFEERWEKFVVGKLPGILGNSNFNK